MPLDKSVSSKRSPTKCWHCRVYSPLLPYKIVGGRNSKMSLEKRSDARRTFRSVRNEIVLLSEFSVLRLLGETSPGMAGGKSELSGGSALSPFLLLESCVLLALIATCCHTAQL